MSEGSLKETKGNGRKRKETEGEERRGVE